MIRLLAMLIPSPTLCRAIVEAGFGVALQSTLLLGLGLLAARALHRRGPMLAALIYQAALVAVLLGGLLSVALGSHLPPLWRLPLPPAGNHSAAAVRPVWPAGVADPGATPVVALGHLPGASDPLHGLPGGSDTDARGTPLPRRGVRGSAGAAGIHRDRTGASPNDLPLAAIYTALAAGWIGGGLLLLGWLLFCHLHLGRLRREARPLSSGAPAMLVELSRSLRVRRPVLLVSPRVGSPFLTGLWRPAILLPAGCEQEIEEPALRAILAHELVHLARRDCAWNLLVRLAGALLWFQPLLWVLGRLLQQASEAACDQEVVRLEGDPRAYADCLLSLCERWPPFPRERALGLGVVPLRSALGRRIEQILVGPRPRPLSPRGRAALLLGAGAAVALALFLRPAGATLPQPVLLQEPRLETKVTLRLRKCPLSAVLAGIEQQTGVKLSAARDVADEPAIVFVTGQPAREVMQHLATLFNFRWTRKGKPDQPVYELYQDLKSRQEEEARREQGVQKALAGLQRAIRDRLELTRRSPEALQREADALAAEEATIEAALRSAVPGSAALGRYGSVEAAHRRLLSLDMAVVQRRTMADPLQRVLTRIAGTLTPAQWEALQAGQSLVFSTRQEEGTLPLSPGLSQSLRGAKLKWGEPHITYRHDSPEEEARFRQMEAEMQQGWERAEVIRLSIWLDVSPRSFGPLDHAVRPGEAPSRQATLQVVPLVQPAADFRTTFLTRPTGLKIASHEVPEAEEAKGDTGKGDRTGPPPDTDPMLEIKRPFPLRLKSTDPDANWFHAQFPNEVLPLIATRYGVNVISDAYRQRFLFAPSEPSGAEQTLRAALDRYVLPRAQWSREGAFIHVRRWTWYDDRLAEIPERLVNHWSERLRKQRLLSPDEAGELALSLQDPQLEAFEAVMRDEGVNFVSMSGGLITRALDADVLEKKELLRAYASLSTGQRQSLMAGRPLSWSEMPASTRRWLRTALWQQLRLPADPTDRRRLSAQPLLTLTPVQGLRLYPVKIEDSAVPGGSYLRYDFDLQFREDNQSVDFFLFSPRIELKRPTRTELILADDKPASPSPPPTGAQSQPSLSGV